MNISNAAIKYENFMIEVRRKIHMFPEIDRDLNKTADLICSILDENSIGYRKFENNGIIAEVGSGERIVALRADMDALPIKDLKDVPYKSRIDGFMHACGHDAHTAILLGACLVLNDIKDELSGRVRFIFQPAEETDGGAQDMISFGALDGVFAIGGLHVEESLEVNTVGLKEGVVYASSNPFKINVFGKGAHGAHPEDGIDSIYISSKIVDNLQGLVSREISPLDSAVITIGKIYGGSVLNAICPEVTMEGILRTLKDAHRKVLKERIAEIVDKTAAMYRGHGTVDFKEGYPSFENNRELFNLCRDTFNKIEGVKVVYLNKPTMGVEDFSYYTKKVPGVFYKLGCGNVKKGIVHPAHGGYFDIDETCLLIGCILHASFAVECLNNYKCTLG